MRASQPTAREIRIALVITAALLLGKVLLQVVTQEARRSDFTALYTGGTIVRQGNGSKLYDLEEQTRVKETLFEQKGMIVNTHPPFEALILAPLTRLSYLRAYVVWGIINILFWMAFVYLVRPHAPVPKQTFQYFILCFGFFPLWVALLAGQTTLPLLVLYCLTFVSLKHQKDFRAGVFLGLGLFKFQLVLPFALICLFRQKWRLMAGFVSAALLLGVLSTLAVGPAGMASYIKLLFYIVKHPTDPAYIDVLPVDMPTVRGFLSVLLTGRLPLERINAVVAIISVFLVLFTAWRWRQEDRRKGGGSQNLMFAAALAITLMTSFHLYVYDLSLLVLVVLLVFASSQWSEPSNSRLVLNASIVILYLPPVYLLLRNWADPYLLWVVLVAFAFAVFGLLGRSPRRDLDGDGSAGIA